MRSLLLTMALGSVVVSNAAKAESAKLGSLEWQNTLEKLLKVDFDGTTAESLTDPNAAIETLAQSPQVLGLGPTDIAGALARVVEERATQEVEVFLSEEAYAYFCATASSTSTLLVETCRELKVLGNANSGIASLSAIWAAVRAALIRDAVNLPIWAAKELAKEDQDGGLRFALALGLSLKAAASPQDVAGKLSDIFLDISSPNTPLPERLLIPVALFEIVIQSKKAEWLKDKEKFPAVLLRVCSALGAEKEPFCAELAADTFNKAKIAEVAAAIYRAHHQLTVLLDAGVGFDGEQRVLPSPEDLNFRVAMSLLEVARGSLLLGKGGDPWKKLTAPVLEDLVVGLRERRPSLLVSAISALADGKLPDSVYSVARVAAELAEAKSGDDVKKVLEGRIGPIGSYRERWAAEGLHIYVDGLVGGLGGVEFGPDPKASGVGGLHASVGVNFQFQKSFGLYVPVLDLTSFLSIKADKRADPTFSTLISVGGYFLVRPARSPFVVGFGATFTPFAQPKPDAAPQPAGILGLFLAVDVGLFRLL